MLARATFTAKDTATRAAFPVSVRAGKAAVNAYLFKSLSVFFSEMRAEIIVKHSWHLSFPQKHFTTLLYELQVFSPSLHKKAPVRKYNRAPCIKKGN